jgi:hypothetical protein
MTSESDELPQLAAPKKHATRPALGGTFGHIAVIVFLLVLFGLAILCVGIGLTWFSPAESQVPSAGQAPQISIPRRPFLADCHSSGPAV